MRIMTNKHKPLALIILDGWGYREETSNNAIAAANIPTWKYLWQHYPHTLISGSGSDVGLPPGQMGNSEVGHLHMGAGRLVPQDLMRFDHAIYNGDFFNNPTLVNAITTARDQNSAVHVIGLLSPGGVHSHERHIHALVKLAAQQGLQRLYLHAILDGRDTPPRSAFASLIALEKVIAAENCGQIVSIIGRYYAMDRDHRWERTERAYDLYTSGIANYHTASAESALELAYARGENDEFVQASTIHDINAKPITIDNNDVVITMNFRADRMRQLTRAFTEDHFSHFQRKKTPRLTQFVTLTKYAANLSTTVAYLPQHPRNVFGEYIASLGMKQLRIAETEKYAHVTFFFNGGREAPFTGEKRILIPSPKISTYDLKPEMSAPELTQQLIAAIRSNTYDVIICNFANPDMVGHSGNMSATIKAIEVIDDCLRQIIGSLQQVGGEAIITSDHGNAECMYDRVTQQAHTAHTANQVPFLYVGRNAIIAHDDGTLTDIAPTLLYLLDVPQAPEMTGRSLVKMVAD
jgi:2,3-bisphosphoglycerate-independent phosphoglycerate mutase